MPGCPSDGGGTAGEGSEQAAENVGATEASAGLLRPGQAAAGHGCPLPFTLWHSLDFLPPPRIAFTRESKKTTGIFKKPRQ